jgi:hypothetical protein
LNSRINAAGLVGAVAGSVAGLAVLGAFVALGRMLMSRVASPIPLILLAIAGAYAGWLLGVIIFSAVRGGNVEKEPRG